MHSLPTTGPLGINFRSRLEARWAQFFTLCQWPWIYEPDLNLRRYIPDFALTSGSMVLVEVKPEISLKALEAHKPRIEQSKAVAKVLLLGANLSLSAAHYAYAPGMGLLGFDGMNGTWGWHVVTLEDVKREIAAITPIDFRHAQLLWIRAANKLQWQKEP